MTRGDAFHLGLPDGVPLILKASCDERIKRIRFAPDLRLLSISDFQRKVAHAFQFDDVDFSITWQDDDGERCEIASVEDLHEALSYFTPSTPSSTSEGGSATGEDGGSTSRPAMPPITMRVNVCVETAVSLSDFGSSVWGESDAESEDEVEQHRGIGNNNAYEDQSYYDGSSASSSWVHSSGRSRLGPASSFSGGSRDRASKPSRGNGRSSAGSVRSSKDSFALPGLRYPWQQIGAGQSTRSISQVDRGGHGSTSSLADDLGALDKLTLSPSTNESDADSDSDDSTDTRAPRKRVYLPTEARNGTSTTRDVEMPNGFNVHVGVACKACFMDPIVGVRYHCAFCVKGADFCEACERDGSAVRKSTHHTESHLMIKVATPLHIGEDVADLLSSVFQLATRRLVDQANSVSSTGQRHLEGASASTARSMSSPVASKISSMTTSRQQQHQNGSTATPQAALAARVSNLLKCSFCLTPIVGVRYLCANCPINGVASHEGYNLCHSCESHSLKCHDPTHFFLKISPIHNHPSSGVESERLPLGDRWDVQEMTKGGSLLPCLYAELEPFDSFTPTTARSNSGNTHSHVHNRAIRTGDGLVIEDGEAAENAPTGLARWTPAAWRSNQSEYELRRMQQAQSRHIVPMHDLFHPSILCDSCFQVIHGAWFRCCHCTTSYDLCGSCMSRIAHDPTHAFAVFKQPVDLDLFKSIIDHQDAGDDPGASRPMLAFPLT